MRRLAILVLLWSGQAGAEVLQSAAGPLEAAVMAEGLEEPWAIDFLPGGAFLVTERGGVLKHFTAPGAEAVSVSGLPEFWVDGQGGLLDVMIPADFAETRALWLSYAAPVAGGGATAVGTGTLSPDGTALQAFTQVFVMTEGSDVGRHFGSRIVEAEDGTVFVTFGDRGIAEEAQNRMRAEGKVVHLNRDGSPATVLPEALPGVYALGLRNAQGAALDLSGKLLTVEHGPKGGDELNAPYPDANFGWPLVTYGIDYSGSPIGVGTQLAGTEQPLHYWDPSIAPSGLMVYSGKLIPEWKGDIFFGSLNSDFLGRLDPDKAAETGFAEERISGPVTGRLRDVVEAPDGAIWFLSVTRGAAYRLVPADAAD